MRPRRPGQARASFAAPGAVRLIGGTWKRRLLPVPDVAGLRPTPNRVRETLFNWLTHGLSDGLAGTSVLDLFAGSGALGFEAASRGATRVVMVDSDATAATQLRASRQSLGARQVDVRSGDALSLARSLALADERFDVIFLDPPFGRGLIADALPWTSALLTENGFLYVEAEVPLAEGALGSYGLVPYRADKAGDVFYHLLRRNIKER